MEWRNQPPLSPYKGGGNSLKKIILVLKTYFKNESSPPCANGMAKAKGARGMKRMVNWVSCWGWSNHPPFRCGRPPSFAEAKAEV